MIIRIRRSFLSWYYRNLHDWSLFHLMLLSATSPPTLEYSWSLPTPWPLFWYCWSWLCLYDHHRKGQKFYWCHSTYNIWDTLDSLSPNLDVIPSRNSSKSTSRPNPSRSAIMLKIVGFLDSNPKLCMADLSSLGSILPVASVSNKLKAYLNSSISSSVSPGLCTLALVGYLDATGLPLVAMIYLFFIGI